MNTTCSVFAWTSAKERSVGTDLEDKYFMTSYSENIQATLEIFFFHLSKVFFNCLLNMFVSLYFYFSKMSLNRPNILLFKCQGFHAVTACGTERFHLSLLEWFASQSVDVA